MIKNQSFVIIGNGITGITAAETLRAADPSCAITLVADDPYPAYYRPALKDVLGGHLSEERLWARPATFYRDQQIRFLPGRVVGFDFQQHVAILQDGYRLRYQRLLLANGARPRPLACPGSEVPGVFTLRTIADYQELLKRLPTTRRVIVYGSGTLALESSETLRQRGLEVCHLMRGDRLWSEVLDSVASDMVLQEERRDGIDVRTGEAIVEVVADHGKVTGVVTSLGTHLPCDLLIVAIGIEPEIGFLRTSGIACGQGVRVDPWMRTNVPDIYAAGDVVETIDRVNGTTRVLGQWFPAIQQARKAAFSMLAKQVSMQEDSPRLSYYNATFLQQLDFVSFGLTQPPASRIYQELVAPAEPRSYRKVIVRNGYLAGVLLLGNRSRALALKRAFDHSVNLQPVLGRIFDEQFDLDGWLTQQGIPEAFLRLPDGNKEELGKGLLPAEVLRSLPDIPALVVLETEKPPQMIPLTPGRNYLLGRDQRNDLVLDEPSISRTHAELVGTSEGFVLRDLSSSYGVFINQARVEDQAQLAHGDLVALGNLLVFYSAHIQERNLKKALSEKPARPRTFPVAGLEHRKELVALSETRRAFEVEMCIGCNRCMDACPVPISSQIPMALLNHTTLNGPFTADIARFTHECILCGSCVPVCPVDNHRDQLMLALKERLGVSWLGMPDQQQLMNALPSGWPLPQLLQRLRAQPMLHDPGLVPDSYLLHLIVAAKPMALKIGQEAFREGEYGRDFFLILEGCLELVATDQDGLTFPVSILKSGEHVGEEGMLTGQPYQTTARARIPTLLYRVPEQVMQRLSELAPVVRAYFERLSSARSLQAILKRSELFREVSDTDIQALASQASVTYYERNVQLFAEDSKGRPERETLHILLEGFVKVARREASGAGTHKMERVIAYRQSGDYFVGGLDLLGDGQVVTVTTINRCRVAVLPRRLVLALFQRYPGSERRFTQRLQEYLTNAVSFSGRSERGRAAKPEALDHLHALVSDGVVEGTEVLVIDLDKCIHCNECEEACARRHGHSRMNRKGMVIGNISIATACRQCADPVCMLCSRAGIARHPDGEVYITESCIGCGICAERCPYGAISIVQLDEGQAGQASWQRFNGAFAQSNTEKRRRRSLPVVSKQAALGPLDRFSSQGGYDELRKKIAVKCDLCAGYRDQACVQACPTGAAIRVQPQKFFGSTADILRH